jgi:hypothetical protein
VNRAVSGTVVVEETGQPLTGLTIVVGRLRPGGIEPLGWTVSGDLGRFRIDYPPLGDHPDLLLWLYGADGRFLYAEPPHRSVSGAELNLRVEVPAASLREGLH